MGQGFIRSIVTWDTRLTQNEVVLGVVAGGESVAYPLAVLVELGGVVVDVIGGEPVVVFADAESSLSAAFSRRVGGRVLDFENVSDTGLDIVDEQTGSVWTPDGRAVSGPLEGEVAGVRNVVPGRVVRLVRLPPRHLDIRPRRLAGRAPHSGGALNPT